LLVAQYISIQSYPPFGSLESNFSEQGNPRLQPECPQTLTKERLFGWHAALFPTGYSGLLKIETGQWRTDKIGPMQVVSNRSGRERVHYEAPSARRVDREMDAFLNWFNAEDGAIDPVLKAGIAHLWFVTIHPFEDGNGRIGRAITDMALARSERTKQRFYSMSA
jgi:Fic family protein